MRANPNVTHTLHRALFLLYMEVVAAVLVYELYATRQIHPGIIIGASVPLVYGVMGLYALRFQCAWPPSRQPSMHRSWSALALGVVMALIVADGIRLLMKNVFFEASWPGFSWQTTVLAYAVAFAIGCTVVTLIRPYFALRDIPNTIAQIYAPYFSKQFRFR